MSAPSRRIVNHHAPTTSPLDTQLAFLRRAGFEPVDLFWNRLDLAMFGEFKPK